MNLGILVEMSDGRIGTVVFNGLSGVGIKWGVHYPNPKDFEGTSGGVCPQDDRSSFKWEPDALLRDPWPGAEIECVGKNYNTLTEKELATLKGDRNGHAEQERV